jgi:hypothetical protein
MDCFEKNKCLLCENPKFGKSITCIKCKVAKLQEQSKIKNIIHVETKEKEFITLQAIDYQFVQIAKNIIKIEYGMTEKVSNMKIYYKNNKNNLSTRWEFSNLQLTQNENDCENEKQESDLISINKRKELYRFLSSIYNEMKNQNFQIDIERIKIELKNNINEILNF